MDDLTRQKLLEQFGLPIVEAVTLYLPAAKKLTLDEFQKLLEYIAHKMGAEARKLVRQKMTRQELVAEKQELVVQLKLEASDQADTRQTAKNFLLSVLTATVSAMVVL